ncbi:MAG: 2-oxoglutarate dehydrogenase E1 component [Acidobacteria bacterium]|nr:2-oxoglutarate dehydrogenase E1 component [Acidobacteriota bacterium]
MVAHGPVNLLRISKDDFDRLLDQHSGLARGLLRKLASRLRLAGSRQEKVDQIVRAFRLRGHVLAQLDPLGVNPDPHPELTLEHYGLTEADLDRKFAFRLGKESTVLTLREILAHLRKTYCGAIGVQFLHIDDLEIQTWLRERMEETANQRDLSREEKIRILTKLTDAEVFENFLHRKFVGAKRFSLEGGESLIPLLDHAIEEAGIHGIEEIVIGMAHRGRLNVLANIMGKPARQIFREFKDLDAVKLSGKGDVKYHLGYSCDRITVGGRKVHLSLCFNPSHLGFVGPVAVGRTRAKQDRFGDRAHTRALPLLIHGDAAFVGQGVTQELFNMSRLHGYTVGGTVHVVLNNQIGFTTNPEEGRSCQYSTDVARMLQIPIFHVNGEHPEAVSQVIRLAMDFRQKFHQDVVIDMYCYRKYGHNEGDDPTFTQPTLYSKIKKMPTVRKNYVENLKKSGGISDKDVKEIHDASHKALEEDLAESIKEIEDDRQSLGLGLWKRYQGGPDLGVPDVNTAISMERAQSLIRAFSTAPKSFNVHPKVQKFMEIQHSMAIGETPLNWGAGELLAFASLVTEGVRVRLSGQDCGRGTFSHRHAMLSDYKNGQRFIPLQHLSPDQAKFEVLNSPLSEIAVLGFEYGYSLDLPDGLVIWEAQFGDFSNVAQVIIDQFISSSEDKWSRLSGLALLLPHGFEGQGPEHSSARLERFLNLAAEDNLQIVNLTTPAQLFHCLRRQVLRKIRKPLVVMSPKSLLRHPEAVSELSEFTSMSFQRVIPDRQTDAAKVRKILLCSGKLYYELLERKREEKREDVAIVRLEQYYPIPMKELEAALAIYPENAGVTWVQEEPANMGAWYFLKVNWENKVLGRDFCGVTRPASASPATGSSGSHKMEQARLLDEAFS